MQRRKKLIAIIILILFTGTGLSAVINYFKSSEEIKISYKNSREVKIYDTSNSIDGDKKLVKEVVASDEKIRLKKGFSYSIEYRGAEKYESGKISFAVPSEDKHISIDPPYSQARLNQQLNSDLETLHQTIKNSFENMHLYEIQRGKLYHTGEWYGATLEYIGQDAFSADTLRIVMKKENGIWKVKSELPYIYLSKFAHPDVPKDVLSDINKDL